MHYSEVESLTISSRSELVVGTSAGEWRESAPLVYQQIGSRRIEVPASYRLLGDNDSRTRSPC